MADAPITATAGEQRNGWTAETVEAYRAERDEAAGHRVPGLVVTEFTRPKPQPVMHGPSSFNPHRW